MPSAPAQPVQQSLDDLGTPLHEVTFCVIDLETTGGSPRDCAITEIGAVKLRGGECLGTLQTLVNPGQAIPPQITVLTGITESMVLPAPRIEEVLPSLLEFIGSAVIVGHNVRFDLGFLVAALERDGRPPLPNRSIDTCGLARRLIRDEVPNCRLGTLASRLRLDHRPTHRALDDALSTGDLLHALLERVGPLGITGLDDLLVLPTIKGHAQAAKLALTEKLPREPGVYLFRGRDGEVLYVGKATNLRSRVRSYFSGDTRRKIGPLLREAQRVDHIACGAPLEAAVLEVRLIHQHQPRFNRQGKRWSGYCYVKLTCNERFPRLSIVRVPRPDGGVYLGPLQSKRFAQRVVEAIQSVSPIRRCTATPGRTPRESPCAPAQLGVAHCPCAGSISAERYREPVDRVVRAIRDDPDILLGPLRERMTELADAERFEEAADVRDRAAALAGALRRQRRFDELRRAGRLVVETGGGGAELWRGRLVRSWVGSQMAHPLPIGAPEAPDAGDPLPRDLADELSCVASWLDRSAAKLRVVHCTGGLASPLPRLPSFDPARGEGASR